MVERQDPDNFTSFQTRERCALEIAAYVFKTWKFYNYYRDNQSTERTDGEWAVLKVFAINHL